jgi:predicted HicB family RNase H-like nuclease
MTNTKLYKGYIGSVDIDLEANYLHGKVLHVQDLVTFTSPDVAGLQAAFEEAVDDYLQLCEEVGKEPDRPFSGVFQVRMTSDQHRALCMEASSKGLSLNELSVQKLTAAGEAPRFVIKTLNVSVQAGQAPELVQPAVGEESMRLVRHH